MLLSGLFLPWAQAATLEHFMPYDAYGSAKAYSDLISLNPQVANAVGAIWGQKANNLPEWSLALKYRINGPEHGGKGMAIWYAADRGQGGQVYGSADNWEGFGLFLTTESDGTGALRGHLNDRSTSFAKLESMGASPFSLNRLFSKSEAEKNAFGGCVVKHRNVGMINSIKVSYNKDSIKVMHNDDVCFENFDVALPNGYYFGASSQGAEQADSHELFAFDVSAQSHVSGQRPNTPAAGVAPAVPPEKAQGGRAGFPGTNAQNDVPAALDSAMQKIITKLIADSDKMSARIEELMQMKSTMERIEASLVSLGANTGTGSNAHSENSKALHEDVTKQIRQMEEKFVQMERHIEKQTDHIISSLPPVAKPLKTAVYVIIFVQLVICGAYIMYRRKVEEKSKFL